MWTPISSKVLIASGQPTHFHQCIPRQCIPQSKALFWSHRRKRAEELEKNICSQQHINDHKEKWMSTYCGRDNEKLTSENGPSIDRCEVKQWWQGALWWSTHALHRQHWAMQHDPSTFMLALYTFNICQLLKTGHSRKVFYTDKGFLRALCTCYQAYFTELWTGQSVA